jgi:hypothetical protein
LLLDFYLRGEEPWLFQYKCKYGSLVAIRVDDADAPVC